MNPEQIKAALGRKVGPLPVGAWLAVVALGVGVTAAIIRKRRAAAGLVPEPLPADAPTTDVGNPFAVGGFTVGGLNPGTGSGVPASSPGFSQEQPEQRTNSDWETAAVRWAIAKGFTPTAAAGALSKFIGGEKLTAQEKAIVDAAMIANGPPPQNVPPPALLDTPTDTSVPGEGGEGGDQLLPLSQIISLSQRDAGVAWWAQQSASTKARYRAAYPGLTFPS